MVQKLEAIRGGGGSIKVGTTGTVSALIIQELNSMIASPQTSTPKPIRELPGSVEYGASSTPKRPKPRKSSDEASSSRSTNSNSNHIRRPKDSAKTTHRIPMLGSDNVSLDRTPSREKNEKRVNNIVEIVDVKCGNPDRAWASHITSRLKKLGFSKLSESVV